VSGKALRDTSIWSHQAEVQPLSLVGPSQPSGPSLGFPSPGEASEKERLQKTEAT
jgi:hypothetical protein